MWNIPPEAGNRPYQENASSPVRGTRNDVQQYLTEEVVYRDGY